MVHLSLAIVPIKLIAPRRDDKPTKWTEKITRSTDVPGWPIQPDNGAFSKMATDNILRNRF